MLYKFILDYVEIFTFLNVFKYLTVRTGLAMFTSLFFVFAIGTPFINFFSAKHITNPIREDGPDDHIIKKIGTPTMGGLLILIGLFSGVLLWCNLSNIYIWTLIFVVASFGYKKYLSIEDSKDILGFTFRYREDPIILDPRNKNLGARLIINLEKLYF